METDLKIDVAKLDGPHRRALEEVIGRGLQSDQRLAISVVDSAFPRTQDLRPAQTLEDWTSVFEGLSDQEIAEIDAISNARPNLTRHLPQ